MVIELDLPAPLRVVRRIPPLQQLAGLASRQEHQPADVLVRRPDILALDGITTSRQARDRRVIRLLQVVALGQVLAVLQRTALPPIRATELSPRSTIQRG